MRHELNNILQIVSANLELLRSHKGLDDAGRARVASALAALERAIAVLDAAPAQEARSSDPQSDAGGPLRIVVTEDDAIVRSMVAGLLSDMGHRVTAAGTAHDALRALAAGADLLITDVGLPDMNGEDLADTAVAALPGLAVLIASGETPSRTCSRTG